MTARTCDLGASDCPAAYEHIDETKAYLVRVLLCCVPLLLA